MKRSNVNIMPKQKQTYDEFSLRTDTIFQKKTSESKLSPVFFAPPETTISAQPGGQCASFYLNVVIFDNEFLDNYYFELLEERRKSRGWL